MVRVQRAGVGGWHFSGLPCIVDKWLCVVPAILAPRWGINGSWYLVWVWGHHHWGPCPSLTVGGSLWAHLRLHCNGSHDCVTPLPCYWDWCIIYAHSCLPLSPCWDRSWCHQGHFWWGTVSLPDSPAGATWPGRGPASEWQLKQALCEDKTFD